MSINEAIKKAIEGGWFPKATRLQFVFEERGHVEVFEDYHIFLDPLFWQALFGKEKNFACPACWRPMTHAAYFPDWQYQMVRFVNHLASGKSAEDFFAKLDKK